MSAYVAHGHVLMLQRNEIAMPMKNPTLSLIPNAKQRRAEITDPEAQNRTRKRNDFSDMDKMIQGGC